LKAEKKKAVEERNGNEDNRKQRNIHSLTTPKKKIK
jgi:hypothetical protein